MLDRVEVDDIMLKNLFGEMLIIAKQTMWNKSYKQRLDLYRRYSEELTIEDLKVIWVMHPKMLTEDARILLSQREDNKDFLEVLWEGIKPRKLVNSYKNIIKRRLERLEMLITNSNSVGHSQKINVKRYYDSESETTKLVMLIQRAVVASRLKMSSILYSCIERLRIVYPEKSSSIDKLIEDYLVFMDKLDKDFNMLSEEDFEDIKNFIHRIAAFINPEDCGKLLRQEI